MKTIRAKSTYCPTKAIGQLLLLLCLAGCSNDDGPDFNWVAGSFPSSSEYRNQCSERAEKFFIRSLFNEIYYWYTDIIDANPDNFNSFTSYFDYLVTDEITASGKPKDNFSTVVNSALFSLSINNSIEFGYGLRLTFNISDSEATIAFVADNSPAKAAGIKRGDIIKAVDSYSLTMPEALRALFPGESGQTHSLTIDVLGGAAGQNFDLTSAAVSMPSTQTPQVRDVIVNTSTVKVGYLPFHDHTLKAESELINHFNFFANEAIEELVIDLRYNPGGFLLVANQVAYMVAGSAATNNRNFETLIYNDQYLPESIPFETMGFNDSGLLVNLPTLDLTRVLIITGNDTCSASESIINGLRGIGVDVVLIGDTTCGKPYGSIGVTNCGRILLPVVFEGVNDLYGGTINTSNGGFADGFKPSQSSSDLFAVSINGCAASDDFANSLGDINENRYATALSYIENNGVCPPATAVTTSLSTNPSATLSTTSTSIVHSPTVSTNYDPRVRARQRGQKFIELPQ